MKKFILLMVLSLCVCTQSFGASVSITKWELIKKADWHKTMARHNLEAVQRAGHWYLPHLEKREYLDRIIEGTLAASVVSEPRMKVLTVALSIIGTIIIDFEETYLATRKSLMEGVYHLEMQNFYNEASLNRPDGEAKNNDGTTYFLEAIDQVTKAEMWAEAIEDDNARAEITDIINDLRKYLSREFNNPKGFSPNDLYDVGSDVELQVLDLMDIYDVELEVYAIISVTMEEVSDLLWDACKFWGPEVRHKKVHVGENLRKCG